MDFVLMNTITDASNGSRSWDYSPPPPFSPPSPPPAPPSPPPMSSDAQADGIKTKTPSKVVNKRSLKFIVTVNVTVFDDIRGGFTAYIDVKGMLKLKGRLDQSDALA